MHRPSDKLFCFAVNEEARPFQRRCGSVPSIRTLVTGMGRRNAEASVRRALDESLPRMVITCGFAGGLTPGLASGTVVYEADDDAGIRQLLETAGARPARIHAAERVATTAAEKAQLRASTGADAVEMESQFICAICRERQLPCAIVRVVLDPAEEDLPLDFNQLMTADMKLDGGRLALTLMRSPTKIPALLRLQRQTRAAAERLAEVLCQLVEST